MHIPDSLIVWDCLNISLLLCLKLRRNVWTMSDPEDHLSGLDLLYLIQNMIYLNQIIACLKWCLNQNALGSEHSHQYLSQTLVSEPDICV